MPDPLPPLGLADLRVTEPDKAGGERFDAFLTMDRVFEAFNHGHPADTIAGVLVDLPRDELQAVIAEMIEH